MSNFKVGDMVEVLKDGADGTYVKAGTRGRVTEVLTDRVITDIHYRSDTSKFYYFHKCNVKKVGNRLFPTKPIRIEL